MGKKTQPFNAFVAQQIDGSSPAMELLEHDHLAVWVVAKGTTPAATLTVEGAPRSGGPWATLVDTAATQSITDAGRTMFAVEAGAAYVRFTLASITGTFGEGDGFDVVAVGYG